jgi:quinol-cytochrome oxidoreductase complex cytochrome b subunit
VNLTSFAHRFVKDNLSLEDALPTQMPVYVASVAYLFGVSTLSSLAMLVVTGTVLGIFGPTWYHGSATGHFVNSLHFWSVQLFFLFIVLHIASKFLMAAWRDQRWMTWVVGALIFGAAVFTGLTGYLSQSNWDSQWIAVQSKDAMNAMGVGAVFNTMNTSQVLTLHVIVMPLAIAALVGLHLFLIRRDSPVKPFGD